MGLRLCAVIGPWAVMIGLLLILLAKRGRMQTPSAAVSRGDSPKRGGALRLSLIGQFRLPVVG